MAKAILTSMNTNSEMSFNMPSPRYEYHLTYVSYEPLNMSDFPAEIDTENIVRNFRTSPTPANPDCTILKTTVPKIEKPKRTVNNSIGQLDLED